MFLLVDIGNSRLKWGVWRDGTLLCSEALPLDAAAFEADLARAWHGLERPARVLASNVAGVALGARISDWLRCRWGVEAEFAHSEARAFGVINAYPDPARLGVDRWVCLVAVRRSFPLPACIVDCGTAVTVDLLDRGGAHRGGLIAPGLTLMRESLRQGTRGISGSDPQFTGLLGRSTEAGVQSGIVNAVAGLIERVFSELDTEYPRLSLVLTGGDAALLAARVGVRSQLVPDLVLRGLAVIAESHPP